MKSKTKKIVRFVGVALAAIFLINAPLLEVQAAETAGVEDVEYLETTILDSAGKNAEGSLSARAMLVNCFMNIVCDSSGMLVEMNTDTVQTATVIGVKDIKIEKKVWYGWKTVAEADGASTTNSNSFMCSVLYANAEVGETYRVTCTHYADGGGYAEVENQTGEFIFTY